MRLHRILCLGLGIALAWCSPRESGAQEDVKVVDAIKLLQSGNWEEQKNALRALQKLGPAAKEAVPAISNILKDSNHEFVRLAALEALRAIGPGAKAAVPLLIRALNDTPQVRWKAAWGLGQIGPEAKEAVPALVEALKTSVDEIFNKYLTFALRRIDLKTALKVVGSDPQSMWKVERVYRKTDPPIEALCVELHLHSPEDLSTEKTETVKVPAPLSSGRGYDDAIKTTMRLLDQKERFSIVDAAGRQVGVCVGYFLAKPGEDNKRRLLVFSWPVEDDPRKPGHVRSVPGAELPRYFLIDKAGSYASVKNGTNWKPGPTQPKEPPKPQGPAVPKLKPQAEPLAEDAEVTAARKLTSAKLLLDNGHKEKAQRVCKEIILFSPKTQAAAEARELLKKLE